MILDKFRYRTAFMWGRAEHRFSRILFISLLVTLFSLYYWSKDTTAILLYCDIVWWLLYWGSHRMEKWFHPDH